MADGRYFGHLRLRGGRYELGGLPLSVAGELARYQSLLRAVAKALFGSDNPGRARVPKGFYDTELLLVRLGKGSVMTYLDEVETSSAEHAFDDVGQHYLMRARGVVNEIFDSMLTGSEPVHPQVALRCASEFAAVGRSLHKDEWIEFYDRRYSKRPRARLDPVVRRSLEQFLAPALDAVPTREPDLAELTLYGHVSGLRTDPQSFDFLSEGSGQIEAYYSDPDQFRVLQGVLGQGDRAPLVAISALADEAGGIVDVVHVESVLPTEWQQRLQSLAGLAEGWLHPGSPAPTEESLRHTEQILLALLDLGVERPGIFPEADGGIQLEWSVTDEGSGVEVVIPNAGDVTLFELRGSSHSDRGFPPQTDSKEIAAAIKGALP